MAHGSGTVWLTAKEDHVRCELQLADLRDLSSAVARVRRLLDLDADPEAVMRVLGADPALGPLLTAVPGIRVPGAVEGGELLLRAVLGRAAGPLAEAIGERLPAGEDGLTTLFPTAAQIVEDAKADSTVLEVAAALADGTVDIHVGRDPEELRTELLALPGIEPRIADYVLMRVLGMPDVLLGDDPVLTENATALGITDLAGRAQDWRPWRSYAGMYLRRAGAGTKEQ